jgi:hypothetical protein
MPTEAEPTELAAQWESDEPDTATDTPADTTPQPEPEQPATEQPEAPPGMRWADGKLVEAEPRSREAKYRTQLRDTESERDQLRDRLERRDRADVERMVAHRLTDPADLWLAGVNVDDLRGEDGEIDTEKVDAAIVATLEAHPHWAAPRVNPAAPTSAVSFGAEKPDVNGEQPTTWHALFDKARGDRT